MRSRSAASVPPRVVKKSVVLHPIMDRAVRQIQAMLLEAEPPVDATYSTALNFMLVGLMYEALKEGGLSREARDAVWNFAGDSRTIEHLNLHHRLSLVRAALEQLEPATR